MTPEYEALLLDIGDVIMSAMWRGLDAFEAATGAEDPRARARTSPDNDPLWQQRVAGAIAYQDYWDTVAQRAGYRRLARALPRRLRGGAREPRRA